MTTVDSIISSVRNRVLSDWYARKDYRTDRHIVVFESDDWGSIRMPRREGWEELLQMGYAVDRRPYERYDTLESPTDLEALFDVLRKHVDSNGNHPTITANMLMVNPDFEKIKQTRFLEYHYEPIADTYKRYFGDSGVLELMRQGIDEGVFMPQSHGREHFNVARWMKGLQGGDEDLLTSFQFGICGIAPKVHPEKGNLIMNALHVESDEEQYAIDCIVAEGLQLFKELWGFPSKTFVAPCYLWNERIEKVLANGDVRLIQTERFSKSTNKTPRRYFYAGLRNPYGQVYSIRNCHFEPATRVGGESVKTMLLQVDKVFAQHKIAVFSTHRINYVGGIDERNRANTLEVLDLFLSQLVKEYPDIEFLSSNQLVDLFDLQ